MAAVQDPAKKKPSAPKPGRPTTSNGRADELQLNLKGRSGTSQAGQSRRSNDPVRAKSSERERGDTGKRETRGVGRAFRMAILTLNRLLLLQVAGLLDSARRAR